MATYAATKAFVRHFSIALRHELREQGYKTKVLTVCPTGIGDTRFKERAQMQDNPLFGNWMAVTTNQVAQDTYRAYQQDRTYVVPKRWLHWINHFAQRLPLSWQLYFARQTLKN